MRASIIAALAVLGACAPHGHDGAHLPGQLGGEPRPDRQGQHALDGRWIAASRAPRPPSIVFEQGRAAGFTGCNRWFADAAYDLDALRFGAVGVTEMACPGPAMQTEAGFLSMIDRTRAYRLERDTLTLLDGAGAAIGTFQRAPAGF